MAQSKFGKVHHQLAIDAERLLVGSLMRDPALLPIVVDLVSANDFAGDWGGVFQVMRLMYGNGEPVGDLALLCNRLNQSGVLVKVGGHAEVAKASSEAGSSSEIYAEDVRYYSTIRQLEASMSSALTSLNAKRPNVEAISRSVESAVKTANESRRTEWITAADCYDVALAEAERCLKTGKTIGISSGFPSYDEVTGGFVRGELTVFGAGTSIGKTSHAMEIAARVASDTVQSGRNVLVVSLEMQDLQLGQRYVARQSGVPSTLMRSGPLKEIHIQAMIEAKAGSKYLSNIHCLLCASMTISQIRAKVESKLLRTAADLVVVDYIGRVSQENMKHDTKTHIRQVVKGLKCMAADFRVPIIGLAQTSRAAAESDKAKLSHLADSADIEREADWVSILTGARGGGQMILSVLKTRMGVPTELSLEFDSMAMRWKELGRKKDD